MDEMEVIEGEMEIAMMMEEIVGMVHQLHRACQGEGTSQKTKYIYVVQGPPGPEGYAGRDGRDGQVNPLPVINVPAVLPKLLIYLKHYHLLEICNRIHL